MKSHFELWLDACKMFGTKVYELEPGLYKTWDEYLSGSSYYRTEPVYQVWKGDKRIYCGMSYLNAVRKAKE